jgi:AraC-like DNA-binding protein
VASDLCSPSGVRVDASVDGDDFMMSVPGAGGSLVRTGRGSDATRVAVQEVSSGHLAVLDFGFPMVGTAHSEGDHLIVCHMLRAPAGGRWDGTELAAGQSFIYPPGSSQVAADPEGLRFGMVVVPWADFEQAAAALGFDHSPATHPHVRDGRDGSRLAGLFGGSGGAGSPSGLSAGQALEMLLDVVVRATCRPTDAGHRRRRRRWESHEVVADVVDWLSDSGSWQVPVLTLCRQAGVSERRLQTAFRDVFDVTPGEFLRIRALQAAHRALRSADPGSLHVGDVARGHGFAHGGRFASSYAAVYGEPPSATLRSSSRSGIE